MIDVNYVEEKQKVLMDLYQRKENLKKLIANYEINLNRLKDTQMEIEVELYVLEDLQNAIEHPRIFTLDFIESSLEACFLGLSFGLFITKDVMLTLPYLCLVEVGVVIKKYFDECKLQNYSVEEIKKTYQQKEQLYQHHENTIKENYRQWKESKEKLENLDKQIEEEQTDLHIMEIIEKMLKTEKKDQNNRGYQKRKTLN